MTLVHVALGTLDLLSSIVARDGCACVLIYPNCWAWRRCLRKSGGGSAWHNWGLYTCDMSVAVLAPLSAVELITGSTQAITS